MPILELEPLIQHKDVVDAAMPVSGQFRSRLQQRLLRDVYVARFAQLLH
jgi:hypothetical protein